MSPRKMQVLSAQDNQAGRARHAFYEEDGGFSSLGMVIALLITLSLLFSTAQVYRVYSASADIQDVADASALAAQNQVAEFMVIVRVCDAIILSLSLAGLTCAGLGVVALCTPKTAVLSEKLLSSARKLLQARATFSKKAAAMLDTAQKALPFLATAQAACVAQANNAATPNANYLALAILEPLAGAEISVGNEQESEELLDRIDQDADEVREAAQEAEQAAQEANEAKEKAFLHDCGLTPNYCMYERARNAVGLEGNLSHSVDTWHFADALERAKDYYLVRSKEDVPESASIRDLGQSQLRKRFYRYAYEEVSRGYVHETEDTFEAYFPLLPRTTAQTAQTELFSEPVYPVTNAGGQRTMHAWDGCPNAQGVSYYGSISELEEGGFAICPLCEFESQSMGNIASASTNIENGFEYHYRIVAQQAEEYEKAVEQMEPSRRRVKEATTPWLESIAKLLGLTGDMRLHAQPPGSYGTVVLMVNLGAMPASTGFQSSFVSYEGTLGARAAVSGATMIEESSSEGATVLNSLLDGIRDKTDVPGVLDVALDCWSDLLLAYSSGQTALTDAVGDGLASMPLNGASKLGTWAKSKMTDLVESVGLQPASLNALKPVTVNTSRVAEKGSSAFSARYLVVKDAASALSSGDSAVFSSLVSNVEQHAVEALGGSDGTIEIATLEPFGPDGPSIPITVTLPQIFSYATESFFQSMINAVSAVAASITQERRWQ